MAMIIDSHIHIYDQGFWAPRWFDNVAYRWAYTPPQQRDPAIIRPRIEAGMVDPDGSAMVANMDAAGVDLGVILTMDWELGFKQKPMVSIEQIHERYAQMAAKHEGRLIAFAGVDPQRPNALELLEWAVQRLGMRGLKLYPPTGFYPYEERVYPLYERCEAWGLPVLCHTGGTIPLLRPRFANPVFLQDVQADFPRLVLWFGHAGGRWWWDEAVSVAANGANSYLELSNWEETAYEEEEAFIRQLARARNRLGAHRILWGSDHFSGPRFRGREHLVKWAQWFRDLPARAKKYGVTFTQEEMDLIMGGNAARCLGLKETSSGTRK
ncbi:MAG: amidohydrolase [Chloroflexi bacterium]|nr:amidohydrolase [Chloroflexota bacterium]